MFIVCLFSPYICTNQMLFQIGWKDVSVSYLFSRSVHQFIRLIEEKEQKQKASSSLCLSPKKNIILIIYFWLEEE